MPRKSVTSEDRKVAVIDLETDPFRYGRKPEAFAAGFFDGYKYWDCWSRNCVTLLRDYLSGIEEPLYVYAHNGGKFDFLYLLELGMLDNPIKIINGRIVQARLRDTPHLLRDSFAILPFGLAKYSKEKIDYDWFEKSIRERYRKDILHYLATDCQNLFELVNEFVNRFGPKLTVGSASMAELSKLHDFAKGNATHDKFFRPFYYGGRVSFFERGILKGNWNVYDVNSMYPFVMRDYLHPCGLDYFSLGSVELAKNGDVKGFEGKPYFAEIECDNFNALPHRTKDGLSFDKTSGAFLACSHEIKVALQHKLIQNVRVQRAYVPSGTISFGAFVDTFYNDKVNAKKNGDRARELQSKYLLNSAYGKFGQSPDNYKEYKIVDPHNRPPELFNGAKIWDLFADYGNFEIWQTPANRPNYFDVAIAASITSAARAVLLDALARCDTPIYCDTDSIICKALPLDSDPHLLGSWKHEGSGNLALVAGKKLYALVDKNAKTIKLASKGAKLDADDIYAICKGFKINWQNDAPTFNVDGSLNFINRTLQMR